MDAQGNVLTTLGPYEFRIEGVTVTTNNHIFYTRAGTDQSGFGLPSIVVELDALGAEIRSFQAPFETDGITVIAIDPLPVLSIGAGQNSVVISWPTNATGFELQGANTVLPHDWSNLDVSPTIAGALFTVTILSDEPGMVFRLIKSP